jgi:hypothetical protein
MPENCIHLPPSAIKDYLRTYGNGPQTKDYELIMALVAERLFADMKSLDRAFIGIPVKPDLFRKLDGGELNLDEVKEVLDEQIENTLMDFCIMDGASSIDGLGRSQGWGIQAKRFGLGQKQRDVNELIDFINSTSQECAPNEYTLMVFVEVDGGFDLETIKQGIDFDNFSFDKLILLSGAEGSIYFHSLYPKEGYVEYKRDRLI